MMEFNKILVTGACGMIGSHFANMLHDEGEKVVVIDKLTYAADRNNLDPFIPFVKGDICRLKSHEGHIWSNIDCVISGVDCIVNFAAETHVDNSLKNDTEFHKTNYLGVANLLKCAVNMEVKRFVQVSTDEIYGPSEDGEYFNEDDKPNPCNPYSASKAAAEMLVNAYHKTYGLNTIITRGSNTFGECQFKEKLIPLCINKALKNEPLPIYGDGSAKRMYIYVKDHARAIEHCMDYGKSGEFYNIRGTVELSALEVATWICNIVGASESLITFVEDRKGHDSRYLINGVKLNLLGFRYQYPHFYDMLVQTVKHYKKLLDNNPQKT